MKFYFITYFILGFMSVGWIFILENDSKIKGWIYAFIVSCLFGLILGGGMYIEEASDIDQWNEGVCPVCGEQWVFKNADHRRNGGDIYYYSCDNDQIIIRIHGPMKK